MVATNDSIHNSSEENVTSVFSNLQSEELKDLAAKITTVGYITVPLFAIFGIVGNLFTLMIMRQPYFRKTPTSVHLSALAIADTTYNFVNPFTKTFIRDIFVKDPKTLTDAGCKIFFSMLRNAKLISSWIVVLVCLERFLVIWFPLSVKRIYTRNVSVFAVVSVVTIVIVFNTAWSILATGLENGKCLPSYVTLGDPDVTTGFMIAGTALYNIIPTLILLVLTPLTILKLCRQMTWRRGIHTTVGNDDSVRVTRMIIAVTVAYIILVTPISTAHSVAFFQGDSIFESKDPSFIIFREFAQTVEQFNYCINFFLYFIFNASFRHTWFVLTGFQQSYTTRTSNNQEARVPNTMSYKADSLGEVATSSTSVTSS